MARSDDHQNKPQIVDGQQRMITLWLWMKSLTLLVPAMGKLKEGVSLQTWDEDEHDVSKVKSNVIDSSDPEQMESIWKMDAVQVEELLSQNQKKIESQVLRNFWIFTLG